MGNASLIGELFAPSTGTSYNDNSSNLYSGAPDTSPITGTSGTPSYVGISTSNPGAAVSSSTGSVPLSSYLTGFENSLKNLLTPAAIMSGAPASAAIGGTAIGASVQAQEGSTISQLFLRGVVIITGFIFLFVGLTMFKTSQVIINTVTAPVKSLAKTAGSIT